MNGEIMPRMNNGKATAIFKQIASEKFSENEKLVAVYEVLEMATHNGITKSDMLEALRYLFYLNCEVELV